MTRRSRSRLEVLEVELLGGVAGGQARRLTNDVGDIHVWCDQLKNRQWLCAAKGPRDSSAGAIREAIGATRQKHGLGPVTPPKREKAP
jgi:hypothetical protein